jgi:coenzyme F420-reducing hydrogenase beta subunit
MSEASTLLDTVVQGGACIGCGACAAVDGAPLRIAWNALGQYQAVMGPCRLAGEVEAKVLAVCPFSGVELDEDAIAQERYGTSCAYHDRIGYYLSSYAGYVAEGEFRRHGSSGGLATWIVTELYRRGLVDAVIHVQANAGAGDPSPLFRMAVSRSEREIRAGAKSRYYPVEMSRVLHEVQQRPGRYAVVGLPCFVKAIRLLARRDHRIRARVAYCVGLVCGHLKSARFADMLAWQMGVPPGELVSIEFRRKIAGEPATRYGIEVVGRRDNGMKADVRRNDHLYGGNWGYGFFKYSACDYCDDVVAETADVSVGDAWLAQYVGDSDGTNVVVVRHEEVDEILREATSADRLHLMPISADSVARSQDGGLRHRREGLAYRLHVKDCAGAWRPRKRVAAGASHCDPRQRRIYELRMLLAARSHDAFREAVAAGEFRAFQRLMAPYVQEYTTLYRAPLWHRTLGRVRRTVAGQVIAKMIADRVR